MESEINIIGLDSTIVRDNEIIFSEADGEMVMVSMERGEYFGLNPIGTRIWGEIKTPKKVSDLCHILKPDYNVNGEQCEKDVLVFLNQMAEKRLVRIIKP